MGLNKSVFLENVILFIYPKFENLEIILTEIVLFSLFPANYNPCCY